MIKLNFLEFFNWQVFIETISDRSVADAYESAYAELTQNQKNLLNSIMNNAAQQTELEKILIKLAYNAPNKTDPKLIWKQALDYYDQNITVGVRDYRQGFGQAVATQTKPAITTIENGEDVKEIINNTNKNDGFINELKINNNLKSKINNMLEKQLKYTKFGSIAFKHDGFNYGLAAVEKTLEKEEIYPTEKMVFTKDRNKGWMWKKTRF